MLRPNIVMDAPPTQIEVGGCLYDIKTDFRIWIDVLREMRELISVPDDETKILHNAEVITRMSVLLLDKPIMWESADQIAAFIAATAGFAKGYPQAPTTGGADAGESVQTYSLEYDLNAIAIAFLKYYGIDISWKGQELHWWLFMEYFRNLCGNDLMILRLMEIRGYTGKDKELRKLASRFAIPKEVTAEDQAILDEIAKEFYGA